MIGQIISHYRLIKLLGKGSFGAVYLANDLNLPRQVAIKISTAKIDDSDSRMRFKREAAIAASLQHPNIATIYEYGIEDDKQYIVMEFVEGHTLQDVLRHGALPSLERCLDVVTEIAKALQAAHNKHVIHRDIKPGNVMLTFDGGVKVLDFGLAKRIKLDVALDADTLRETLDVSITKVGMFVGTAQYVSPEQARGERADERSDLFSLGAVLYECLTGQPAFSGATVREVLQQVLYATPVLPSNIKPQIPAELDRITHKALAKNPAERYQSVSEMLVDLQSVARNQTEIHQDQTQSVAIPPTNVPTDFPLPASTEVITSFGKESPKSAIRKLWGRALLMAALLIVPLVIWGYWHWIWWPSYNLTQPSSLKASDWYKQGLDALQKGFYYQAKQSFENTINEEKSFIPAYARLAEALNELNFIDEAIEKIGVANHDLPRHFLFRSLDELYVDAIYQTVYRRYGEAIQAYQVIAERTMGSERWVANNDLGRAFEKGDGKSKRVAEAISHYQEVVRLRDNPRALIRLAVLHGRKLESEAAKENFKRAESTCTSLRVDECLPEVFYQRGAMLNRTGAVKEAQAQFDKALDSIPKHGEVNQYQNVKIRLQVCSIKSQIDPDAAKALASEVILLAKELGFRSLVIQGLLELGNAHLNSDELDEAAKKFNEALEQAGGKDLPEGKRLPSLAARAHLSLASLYVYRKDENSKKVTDHIEEARKFFESGGYLSEQSQIHHLIGWNNENKDNYAEAMKAYQRQLDLALQTSSDLPAAEANFGLGSIYRSLENWPEAEVKLRQSQEKYASLGDDEHVIQSKIYLSDVLVRLGKFNEAEELLRRISVQTENPDGEFTVFAEDVAMVRLRLDFIQSLRRRNFDEVIKQGRKIRSLTKIEQETLIETGYNLGLAHVLKGEKQVGLKLCEEAYKEAMKENKELLRVKAQLALAEAMLENGRWWEAQANAREASQFFSRHGQRDSEWRANLLTALTSQGMGDWKEAERQAGRARTILGDLGGQWGSNFTNKPDVQYYQKKLDELSGTIQTQSNRR